VELFEQAARESRREAAPLAARMRPQSLDEYVGQAHLLGPGRLLRAAIESGDLHSMILWGPPGTGKTTLASLLAAHAKAHFTPFSAVLTGVKEVRSLVGEAAERQFQEQEDDNDPPTYPELLYIGLGRAYLEAQSPALAVKAFDKALEVSRNDWLSLSGLVHAHLALGEKKEAADALARLLYVTAEADPGLGRVESAKQAARAAGLSASPRDSSPESQRRYKAATLDRVGPIVWEPYEAPRLEATDIAGKRVSLDDYRGQVSPWFRTYQGLGRNSFVGRVRHLLTALPFGRILPDLRGPGSLTPSPATRTLIDDVRSAGRIGHAWGSEGVPSWRERPSLAENRPLHCAVRRWRCDLDHYPDARTGRAT
jgi:tetratricopeptide (TPR) repeat protein